MSRLAFLSVVFAVFVAAVLVIVAAVFLFPGTGAPERVWIPEGFNVGQQPSRQPGGPPIAGMWARSLRGNGRRYDLLHFTRPPSSMQRVLQYVGLGRAPANTDPWVFRPTGHEARFGSVTWFEFSDRDR